MTHLSRRAALLAAVSFLAAFSAQADVKLPAIFGDHMVLQQGKKLPVWGTAAPGEKVTVTVGSNTGTAMADPDGKWRVDLAPLPAGGDPVTMTVAGSNSVTFTDVLIGDVWICSGQSNMEFNLGGAGFGTGFGGADGGKAAMAQANDPQLRFFVVKQTAALEPAADVTGTWQVCTPASAGAFSAVGYFFGRDLRSHLKRPVGLIGTYFGGTPVQAWTSLSGLKKEPSLQPYVQGRDQIVAAYPRARIGYEERVRAYNAAQADWEKNFAHDYHVELSAYNNALNAASLAGQLAPPPPSFSHPPPVAPLPPDGGRTTPTLLFNGMVAPLIPFAFTGVIWYQGEANWGRPVEYRTLFARLITDWREQWGQGDFPFLFVQLASLVWTDESWPFLRESQYKTLALPNTGMATAFDLGNNLHPTDKKDVGDRLALVARHVSYGEELVYSGPTFASARGEGNAIRVTFDHAGGGLVIGSSPWAAPGSKPLPATKLTGFALAGEDGKFGPADAKIENDAVVVSSPALPKPVYIRYNWHPVADGNLYNREGLPAISFRTDNQPYESRR